MRVSETLGVAEVITGSSWADFESVVMALVGRLVASGRVPAHLAADAVASICERERVASTAMVDIGVSIPHTRLDGLDKLVSALAVSSPGVYGASAGTPISIVFLVLSPPSLSGEHLNFLSALSMLLHTPAFRRGLQHSTAPDSALALIRSHERK